MFELVNEYRRRRTLEKHPEGVAFDEQWGTETSAFDWGNYEPSRPSVVAAALDALDVDLPNTTFVDWGAGKGRVALLAAQRPFFRVIGVEHDANLHAVAERNLAAFDARGGRVAPVYFFRGDASRQPLPDGPLVVYLYNPFGPDVLIPALARARRPELRVIYVNPLEELVFSEWRVLASGGEKPWTWRIYAPPA